MSGEMTAEHITEAMAVCISVCGDCHDTCAETIGFCLARGGDQAASSRITALADCKQLCDLTRDVLLRGSPLAPRASDLCADACIRSARACEEAGGENSMLERCADACRRCADACEALRPA
jgi:Domain of Unknown Function (DUF326)